MTTADWIIVGFAAAMGVLGYRRGFIVGVFSLAGFVLGAFLGTRLAPLLLNGGSSSPYAPLFGLLGALFLGFAAAIGLEGVGRTLRTALPVPGLGIVDGALGFLLSVTLALGVAWIVGAVLLQTPGANALRRDVQRSQILRGLNDILPPSSTILNALARFDPLGAIAGPPADVSPPNPRSPTTRTSQGRRRRGAGHRRRVRAGRRGHWLDRRARHRGHQRPRRRRRARHHGPTPGPAPSSTRRRSRSIATTTSRSCASTISAARRCGSCRAPAVRTPAALLGFPRDGPYDVRAVRLGGQQEVLTDDAYGRGRCAARSSAARQRPARELRRLIVDTTGHVVATVFAATEGGPTTAVTRSRLGDRARPRHGRRDGLDRTVRPVTVVPRATLRD